VRRRPHDPLDSDLAPLVEDAARRALADSMTPGLAVALVCHGRIAWAAGYGVADQAKGQLVTPATRFQAASVSKPVTAWGVLRLVEQGRIGLDEPVVGTCAAGAYHRRRSRPAASLSVGCSAIPPACRSTAMPVRPWSGRCHRSRPRCRERPAGASRWSCWRPQVDAGSTRAAATACSSC